MVRRIKQRCPFHEERTPSFIIQCDGTFHCFGCGVVGTWEDDGEDRLLTPTPVPEGISIPVEAFPSPRFSKPQGDAEG